MYIYIYDLFDFASSASVSRAAFGGCNWISVSEFKCENGHNQGARPTFVLPPCRSAKKEARTTASRTKKKPTLMRFLIVSFLSQGSFWWGDV